MIDKVKSTISSNSLFEKGSTVIAAVSGGSDSMALLTALNSLKDELGITLRAAHVNHCLRGNDADRDERFVAEKCAELNVPLDILKVDVSAQAAKTGEGLEECGRRIRYEFFASLGEDTVIATAHNLSDKVETFLFNFARGSALRGLCSIPVRRDNIVRPLIACTKAEILAFCEDNGIEYVTDETNSDVHYSRNRIRHNVVSEFVKINGSFELAAERCMSSLNEDEAFLSSLADNVVERAKTDCGFNASVIDESPLPVKKRALVRICENCAGITPEQKFLPKLCDLLCSGGSLQINGGVTVRVRKGMLDFPKVTSAPCSVELSDGVSFGDYLIKTELVNINEINNLQNFSKQDLEYFIDYDKIHGRVIIRSREAGDKISLKARNCTKSLKKLFNELSVPPEKRNGIAVFSDGSGTVLVEGIGVDSRVCLTDKSVNVLKIKFIKKSGLDL